MKCTMINISPILSLLALTAVHNCSLGPSRAGDAVRCAPVLPHALRVQSLAFAPAHTASRSTRAPRAVGPAAASSAVRSVPRLPGLPPSPSIVLFARPHPRRRAASHLQPRRLLCGGTQSDQAQQRLDHPSAQTRAYICCPSTTAPVAAESAVAHRRAVRVPNNSLPGLRTRGSRGSEARARADRRAGLSRGSEARTRADRRAGAGAAPIETTAVATAVSDERFTDCFFHC